MLDIEEFKSIWDIAFLWEGLQPPEDDLSSIPEGVKKKIEKLIWAFREDHLKLRDSSGHAVYDDMSKIFDILFLNRTRKLLKKCYKQKHYPKSALDNLFIKRVDLLKCISLHTIINLALQAYEPFEYRTHNPEFSENRSRYF